MTSPRHYIFAIDHQGNEEFLHTTLDSKGCREYIKSHREVFGNRFKEYLYGQMCNEKNTWEVIENG